MSRFFQFMAAGLIVGIGLAFFRAEPEIASAAAPAPTVEKAVHKNYTEKMPGDEVTFDMVAIPGGTFMMGSPDNEKGRNADEGPQHQVKIRPFWMGKCEVTWDEFDLWWKSDDNKNLEPPPAADDKKDAKPPAKKSDTDATTFPTAPYVDETYGHDREKHPALCMTHHAAMKYCEWLSKKTGKTYRLPTEAEWEYACRAGSTTAYSFGDDPSKLDDYAWYKKNSGDTVHPRGTTHEVGTKKPNAFGLYDMHGNVMEWCLDHYYKDTYAKFAKENLSLWPVVLPTEKRYSHVARGGNWTDDPDRLRSAARRASDDSWMKKDPQSPQSVWWLTNFDVIGMRIVRPVDEQDNLKGIKSKVTKQSN